jgi:hypothetical protein
VSAAGSEWALARFIHVPVLAAACCATDDPLEETFKEATNDITAIERVSFLPFIPDPFLQVLDLRADSARSLPQVQH